LELEEDVPESVERLNVPMPSPNISQNSDSVVTQGGIAMNDAVQEVEAIVELLQRSSA
jgi:hypothetical protein